MAPPTFTTQIMDVYTCPQGELTTPQSVWRRRQRIALCAVHRIDPVMDLPFQVVFFIRRAFDLGYSNDGLSFEEIWRPALAVSTPGRYSAAMPAVLSYYDLAVVPMSPARPLDDALRATSDRLAMFNGLLDGEFGQSTLYGYWTLVAMVMVFDPTVPDRILNIEVSEPWNYYVRLHF